MFQELYKKSYLARFFGDHLPIAGRLWSCPDHERQLAVVLRSVIILSLFIHPGSRSIRFIMTRTWLAIMVPSNNSECEALFASVVTDAQEVAKDEIWVITVLDVTESAKGHEEKYFVLEATCEVIGRRPEEKLPAVFNKTVSLQGNHSAQELGIRVDWTSYIEHRLMPHGYHNTSIPALISYLKWTNMEEYEQGISKL